MKLYESFVQELFGADDVIAVGSTIVEHRIAVDKIFKTYPTAQSMLPKLKAMSLQDPRINQIVTPIIRQIENGELENPIVWKACISRKLSGRSGIGKYIVVLLTSPISMWYKIIKLIHTATQEPGDVADRYLSKVHRSAFR